MGLLELLADIGESLVDFGKGVWQSLVALWDLIRKVVTRLLSWTASILGWFLNVVGQLTELILKGVVVAFIWILGRLDGVPEQDETEKTLAGSIAGKLNNPDHPIVVIKGVLNKKTGMLESRSELESSSSISADVLAQTGNQRFAELKAE